jgi:hypothetical protein
MGGSAEAALKGAQEGGADVCIDALKDGSADRAETAGA